MAVTTQPLICPARAGTLDRPFYRPFGRSRSSVAMRSCNMDLASHAVKSRAEPWMRRGR
jgi:hypothetical protein